MLCWGSAEFLCVIMLSCMYVSTNTSTSTGVHDVNFEIIVVTTYYVLLVSGIGGTNFVVYSWMYLRIYFLVLVIYVPSCALYVCSCSCA